MSLGRLHVITDTRPGRDPFALVNAALDAGAPVIQLRVKALPDRQLYELAARVTQACSNRRASCIINDRVDIALAVGAAGVHVGADDLPITVARNLIGAERVLGATARDPETAYQHEAAGASYVGVGPVYSTSTKDGLPPPLGPDGLARVAAAVSIPVIAVAGVTVDRVPELLEAGAHGIAVISALSEADDPRLATRELLAALDGEEPVARRAR